jgi:hypothetical protein
MNRNTWPPWAAKKLAMAAVAGGGPKEIRIFAGPTICSAIKSAYPHCPVSMRVSYCF